MAEVSKKESLDLLGELIPTGGGDRIPLVRDRLMVGRRSSCDIVLNFPNISSNHCQLFVEEGYWFAKDLGSRNGTRVSGFRITRKRLDPGDKIRFAKHEFEIQYAPSDLGAQGPPPPDEESLAQILGRSLLDRAGLTRKARNHPEDF